MKMCIASGTEYEDDCSDDTNFNEDIFIENFHENWNETLHHYKNMTLHNIMIYTDTIHINFYVIISLLAVLLLIYILKTVSNRRVCEQLPLFQPINKGTRRQRNNEHTERNEEEGQALELS